MSKLLEYEQEMWDEYEYENEIIEFFLRGLEDEK